MSFFISKNEKNNGKLGSLATINHNSLLNSIISSTIQKIGKAFVLALASATSASQLVGNVALFTQSLDVLLRNLQDMLTTVALICMQEGVTLSTMKRPPSTFYFLYNI